MDKLVKKDWIVTNKGTKIPWPPEDWAGGAVQACLQAEQINSFWAKRDKIANARVHQKMMGKSALYEIRSDMMNGRPR